MAQLKDSVVQGSLRVTDTTYTTNLNLSSATASQIVKTDANKNLIAGALSATEIPTLSITDKTSGTLTVARGGTGVTSLTANSILVSGTTTTAAITTRAITNTTANAAITASTNIPTMNTIYYGLAKINNADQTHATIVYAPTSAGTANQILVSSGGTSAPTWKATASGAAYATGDNAALTFGTLPVGQGGTGRNTLDANNILVGNGTSMVNLRAITDTTTITEVTTGTTIPTMNTVYNGLMYSRVIVATVHGDGSQVSLTYTNSRITANHVVLNSVVPGAGADITVVTSAGSAAITCSTGVPEFNMILAVPQAVIT